MAQARLGDTVKVHYTGKLGDGTVFDSSAGRDPLEFTLGNAQVIPGFEQAVVGMGPGDSTTTEIPCDQAYGQRDERMVMVIDRAQIPDHIQPAINNRLQIRRPDGRTLVVMVTEMSESKVTVDGNHPLAGRDLTFEIELVEIA